MTNINFLDSFFESSALNYPDAIAIENGEKKYSYSEMDKLSNKIANYLKTKEIRPEEKAVILLPRCAEVYLYMLGILKAGGAYIPLDPETPAERINFIMEDSGAKIIITSNEILSLVKEKLNEFPVFNIDEDIKELEKYPDTLPEQGERSSHDLCYMIYTSGTTGTPKGVLLEHRNAVNYVSNARKIYPIDHTFRCLQGFSVSFDASVEEIWVTLSAGATLVVGTFEIMRSGDRLASILSNLNINFFSCAPTLLSIVKEDIPSLKILIFGGEVCPDDFAERWCKEGRKVYNTYGPTEATVIATYSILEPEKDVTIGKALPGYEVHIVDEELNPLGAGKEGEIIIGGESIARGYLHKEELTAKKFITTDRYGTGKKRYYKTGDLGKYDENGNIIYIGRADAQVKVRGFRVELAEIEGLLLTCEGIIAAAVALDSASQQLAAYAVLEKGKKSIDREKISELLRAKLPYYMVPSTLDILEELPMTSSQKIDRKKLPAPQTPLVFSSSKKIVPPQTDLEKEMVRIIGKNIHRDDISMDDNFFNDLGGHSLLAAIITSEMRNEELFKNMSVVDMYKHPILSDLAKELSKQHESKSQKVSGKKREIYKVDNLRYYTCSFFQALSMLVIAFLYGIEWLGPFFVYSYYYQATGDIFYSVGMMMLMYFALLPILSLFAITFKWLVIGKVKAGRYKLWGSYYFRFWLVDKIVSICPVVYFSGTSIMPLFLRTMGAKIGKNCYIDTAAISIFDLLTLGDNVSICTDTHMRGYIIEDGYLNIGTIELQDSVFVGTRCNIMQNTKMEKNSSIEDLTLVSEHMLIRENEKWGGSPAVKTGTNGQAQPIKLWSWKNNILFGISVFIIPLITMIAYFPGMMLISHVDYSSDNYKFLWLTILVGLSFVLFLTLFIALIKWTLLGNIKEGKYKINSFFYYKKWFFDQLMKLSLQVIGTLYTTLYLQIWFKILGVKIGKRVEISTVEFISPDLLVAGDESFLADSVSVGASHVRDGYITIAKTYIGSKTFVGNSAVLSPGSRLGDNVLVGVLSKMEKEDLPVKNGTSWFGSPAVYLPNRDINHQFSAERTYKPSRKLFCLRYFIEFFRVTLPVTVFILLAALITNVASYIQVDKSLGDLLLMFPLLYLAAAIVGTCLMALLKWIIVGKYIPQNKPLWSGFVWRSELVTGLYENFLVLFFLNMLTGTPFIRYPLRLLGCKIGKKTCLFTTQITEFDLIHIDNDVNINDNCTLQTHLFEDRVMKMSNIHIKDECTVGGMAIVLYDSKMNKGSKLEPLSVLMKSETLPENTIFIGAPAKVL